jgi:prepilin-type N-terminal cleavage/methylation domain-containing protein
MKQIRGTMGIRKGVTIIEVAMAIVILSIALPPMVASFADASRQSIRPSNSTVASFLAIDRMEEVVARRYQGTDGYIALTVPSMSSFPSETAVSGFPLFARSTVVEYVTITFTTGAIATSGSDKGYKRVRVTVTWNSGAEKMVVEHLFADFNL